MKLYCFERVIILKNKVSSEDVAKLANVSQSTVSRAFTPNASISVEAKEKVLKAAKKLNYYPNALARGLINKESKIIGLAIKNVQNPFYFEILNKISKRLQKEGLSTLYLAAENETLIMQDVEKFLEFNVDGIIITDALLDIKHNEIVNPDIPIVLFNRYDERLPFHSVSSENKKATETIAKLIMQHKIKTDIYYISGIENTSTNKERKEFFGNYLKKQDIDIKIICGEFCYEKTFREVEELMIKKIKPKAIFAANDIMALAALDVLKKHRVKVPEETIVIGYDNIKMSGWESNDLTTWEQPIDEMIEKTIEILKHNSMYTIPQKVTVSGKLVLRRTTQNTLDDESGL